jgi:hypothetical protein
MDDSKHHAAAARPKQPLDIVVKLALTVFFGSFGLIWGGMYLSRPDRSIPPYSVGSQVGHFVATHVPGGTTDQQLETLLRRFQKVGHRTQDFASMKIQPTTPDDPAGRYRRIVIYVFDDYGWTEPNVLAGYVAGDPAIRKDYEQAMRGYYRLQDGDEEGGLGPLLKNGNASDRVRLLFNGRITDPLPAAQEPEPDTSISPL